MADIQISDLRRDAQSYYRLLTALELAKEEIRAAEPGGSIDIDEVLSRLLPVLAEALNAEQAFVAVLRQDDAQDSRDLQLVAVHPRGELRGQALGWSDLLARLVTKGEPLVIDPPGETAQSLISGLELLNATSAILVRMQIAERVRVVGVCNKAHPGLGPFLAADRMALDSIVELVAIGARAGERHVRDLRSIQETSTAISAELNLDNLLPMIATAAAQVFHAEATSLMLWDRAEQNLVVRASCGLSGEYTRERRVAKEKVDALLRAYGPSQPILIADLKHGSLGDPALIETEHLRSVLAAPLLVRGQLIGALNIYSQHETRDFSPGERELARILANQAATAIHNAQLYEASVRQRQYYEALNEASKAINKASQTERPRQQALERIAEQAMKHISGLHGPKATWSSIQLYDQEFNELAFECVYPPEFASALGVNLGQRWVLDRSKAQGGRIGISGRAILERRSQRIGDTGQDSDYLEKSPTTRSELEVPLFEGGRAIGVLGLESDQADAFDEADQRALEGLAELAVIAINNANHTEQISRSNAVALLGAWGAEVFHESNHEVGNIRRAVLKLLRRSDLAPEIKAQLEAIDACAGRLALPGLPEKVPTAGTPVEFMNAPFLDLALRSIAQSLGAMHPAIDIQLEENGAHVRVAIHERWLRRLAHHLIRNAIQAIPSDAPTRAVLVRPVIQGSLARVEVEDTGSGVRPELVSRLFQGPISHDTGRLGRGLLLVRFLAEQYGGYARLLWSTPGVGSCFAFAVPLAKLIQETP